MARLGPGWVAVWGNSLGQGPRDGGRAGKAAGLPVKHQTARGGKMASSEDGDRHFDPARRGRYFSKPPETAHERTV
jgi:hypothetical protein